MKHIRFRIFLSIMLVSLAMLTHAQSLQEKYIKYGHIHFCKGVKEERKIYVPPPEEFLKQKKRADNALTINVTYVNFPEDAKAAFQYAVDIWESLLTSSMEVNLKAYWVNDLDEGVLGACTSYGYYEDFNRAPMKGVKYPVALAERFNQDDINHPNNPDLIAYFNSDKSLWYLGTDGNTPYGKYDFVSVVLHEITHGLGFTGDASGESNSGIAKWTEELPYIFDLHIENSRKKRIRDVLNYENSSAELYQEFISNELFFESRIATRLGNGFRPKLFAPYQYDPGSSLYHLDERTYPISSGNALMTPGIGYGQAIHDPGNLVRGMFYEMGWTYTHILHQAIKDSENLSRNFKVDAQIYSDNTYDPNSVQLHYSYNNFETHQTVDMVQVSNSDLFSATMPALNKEGKIWYYIQVDDIYRTYYYPRYPPEDVYFFNIGTDEVLPEISHQATEYISENASNMLIEVEVSDNIAVKSVRVEYKLNETGDLHYATLSASEDVLYKGEVDVEILPFTKNDSIMYRIVAVDVAGNANTAYAPSSNEYYALKVSAVLDEYASNFDDHKNDFIGADFKITDEGEFDSPFLYCPYTNAGENNYIDFVAQLKYTIKLKDEDAYLQFHEIALVEPGDVGATYLDDNIFDFVIVEGSKDNGQTWIPFKAGYDSRKHFDWLNQYNADIIPYTGNSMSIGAKKIWKRNTFNLYGENNEFEAGDELLIRFRLHSDPFAYGWGWAIDNLKIQTNITDVSDVTAVKHETCEKLKFAIYPNPTSGEFNIQFFTQRSNQEVNIEILNTMGSSIRTYNDRGGDFIYKKNIDVKDLQQGVYFLRINTNGQSGVKKIIVAQ